MRELKGMEHLLDLDYAKRTDRRFHALGMKVDPAWSEIGRQFVQDQKDG